MQTITTSERDMCNAKRGGTIPYTIIDGRIYTLLGKYKRTKDLCDFGGGIKRDENVLEAIQRELLEELRATLIVKLSSYTSKILFRRGEEIIIFLYIAPNTFSKVISDFRESKKLRLGLFSRPECEEITEVYAYNFETFIRLIEGDKIRSYQKELDGLKMWSKLRSFLSDVIAGDTTIKDNLLNIPTN